MNRGYFLAILFIIALTAKAQIGYQVSLLDQETGVPRANEYVTVQIDLTDNEGNTICSENKSATTNEFGIISLSIGNENTFDGMDWSKLPLWISATVDGVIIGKSQVLNIPVAEYAKRTGTLTKELLCSKTWAGFSDDKIDGVQYTFYLNGTYIGTTFHGEGTWSTTGSYEIDNNFITVYSENYGQILKYSNNRNSVVCCSNGIECF